MCAQGASAILLMCICVYVYMCKTYVCICVLKDANNVASLLHELKVYTHRQTDTQTVMSPLSCTNSRYVCLCVYVYMCKTYVCICVLKDANNVASLLHELKVYTHRQTHTQTDTHTLLHELKVRLFMCVNVHVYMCICVYV